MTYLPNPHEVDIEEAAWGIIVELTFRGDPDLDKCKALAWEVYRNCRSTTTGSCDEHKRNGDRGHKS